MKIRNGFVSNSSSSSFLLMVNAPLYKKITKKKSFPSESKDVLDKLFSNNRAVCGVLSAHEFYGDMNEYFEEYSEHVEILQKELNKVDPTGSKWLFDFEM